MGIMTAIKNEAANTNLVRTENGALGFENHQSDIVDFFYKISSMRQMPPSDKRAMFLKALAEDRELAYRMLFFSRDIRGGLGERKLFRDIYCTLDKAVIDATFKLIPEFGRWDDLICLLDAPQGIDDDTRKKILRYLRDTLQSDLDRMWDGKPCTLLAKWLPSLRKVSRDKMRLAKYICREWTWPEKVYRKNLSTLRGYIRVVEKDMTAGRWGEINFESVPSKAAKNYRKAFARHDTTRYNEYLAKLSTGEAKVNAGAMYPYEIVSAYRASRLGHSIDAYDQLLESQWKSLPLPKDGILGNAIVVRDGSGSMTSLVSGKSTALDIATSLAVLMSENLKGEFKDKFITFSSKPRFVDLGGCGSLRDKLSLAFHESECSNTDIEKTMDLILRVVVKNKIPQSEIPAVVIVSDMEFDEARDETGYFYGNARKPQTSEDVLFAKISQKWEDAGYELPKMVFWNVCSRTAAVPMQENKNGLLLVSGFSQNILDMLSNGGTMLDAIREKLMNSRYDCVSNAISGLV